jgi:hypothetical protein
MLMNIFFINGIYDILCACSMLKIINIPILNDLHLSMIRNYKKNNILFERFFAYWIFTYGVMRISKNNVIISYSYLIEAIFFLNEYVNKSVDGRKTLFVISTSLLLSYVSYLSV